MNCPKCAAPMVEISVNGVQVDRCSGCQGLWFDLLEEQDARADAATIDVGSAQLGAAHDATDRIHCPRCPGTQLMVRMVDPLQPHIRFESCTICYGRFYDAGEYRDFVEFTNGERWRRWVGLLKAR
jgi:Zn-finger nucleic acid-binding protein